MTPDVLTQEEVRFTLRQGIEILVVEDERAHYLLANHCLKGAGINNNIVWFEDGQAVMDFLEGSSNLSSNGKKYIMLLDIRMPKVDGIEVLKRIKSDDNLKNIQVIMLTTSDDQQQAKLCYDLGSSSHVIKPPGKSLLKAIERVSERM
jgi:CheY-like chemotaxis protein